MKQIKASIPDDLRDLLEEAAQKAGLSLSEEIRTRLERTFKDDKTDPNTRKLMATVEYLSLLVTLQTRHEWFNHPVACRILRDAITTRLRRIRNFDETSVLDPSELPVPRPVVSPDDQHAWGATLETIDFLTESGTAYGAYTISSIDQVRMRLKARDEKTETP